MTLPSPLPNFLGIGAPRAGTTWLHEVLDSHPDVLMPSRRKELDFFGQNYERGLEWYAASFQLPRGGKVPPSVGEITPMYMYREPCRERVAELGTVDRFIVCLRNPVDLLWSGYKQNSAIFDFRGDLSEFMAAFPKVVENGFYARALKPWIEQFGLENFIFVRFDDLKADPVATRAAVAVGLGLDPARFPAETGLTQVNRAVEPRFGRLYGYAKRTVTRLHRADHTWVVDLAKKVGLKRLLASEAKGASDKLTEEQRNEIAELYAEDMPELEKLIGLDVGSWLPDRRPSPRPEPA